MVERCALLVLLLMAPPLDAGARGKDRSVAPK